MMTGVRPQRDDIAAPELPPTVEWIGSRPQSMAALTAPGPVLIHFFDFAQLNSVRTLPYLLEWHRRYADAGLAILGVQSPRYPFGADRSLVAAGLERLGVHYPVALDANRELWLDYGCEGWPGLFLWGQGGVLRWVHFGEGAYDQTEEAIQVELRESDALSAMPRPMDPLRPSDAPGATVIAPTQELMPGGDRAWSGASDGRELELDYAAGGAWATLEGAGEMTAAIDGRRRQTIAVAGAGLYELVSHDRHESHNLRLDLSPGLELWSISFAAGVPG